VSRDTAVPGWTYRAPSARAHQTSEILFAVSVEATAVWTEHQTDFVAAADVAARARQEASLGLLVGRREAR